MRILHVLSSPHLGGAEVMCLLLAAAQREQGHDVLVHLSAGGDTLKFAEAKGVSVKLCESQNLSGRRELWHQQEQMLRETAKEFKADIVHSHVPKTNLLCHRALPAIGIPWVATVHGSWRQFGYSPEAARQPIKKPWLLLRHAAGDLLTLRSASRVIAISEYVRGQLRQIGIPRSKLSVVHDGLPIEARSVSRAEARKLYGFAEDAMVVGSLGHMAPVKGFDLLIDAFTRISSDVPKAMLVIAGGDVMGDGTVRASLRRRVEAAKLSERVRLLDRLDERQGFFAALDLFAVASRTEGFSLALVEAMQHGLASVVTSAGGCAEAARPEQESTLFSSGNVRDLAEKLKRLLNDPDLRARLGESGRKRAHEYLTLERCAAEYLDLYKEVARAPGTP